MKRKLILQEHEPWFSGDAAWFCLHPKTLRLLVTFTVKLSYRITAMHKSISNNTLPCVIYPTRIPAKISGCSL